ncbi:MAG: AraC family transcriptional regulator [Clostridia bacterium]|nr:AraC family transcriptional regulator [Clostridia bacterium]
MVKLREHMMENKILYRMIAAYTLLCTLVIICMTTLLYNTFSKGVEKEILQNQKQHLQKEANFVGFRAEYANYLMLQAQQDEYVSQLFYESDRAENVKALNRLSNIRKGVKQLQSIYIYNESSESIYCSAEKYLSLFSDLENFEDQGFVEMLDHIDDYSKYTPFLREISLETPTGQEYNTYVYTYLLYDSYGSGDTRNIMAFNFHVSWMSDALEFVNKGDDSTEKVWIINRDRKIVYSDTGEMIGTTVDEQTVPENVYEEELGYLLIGKGSDKQMLVYASPDYVGYEGWTFLSWNDYSSIIAPMRQVRTAVYLMCIIAMIASALVIIFLSRYIYIPVRQTMDKVESLQIEQMKQMKTERMLFLRKLFMGNEPDDLQQINQKFQKYQIDYDLEAKLCLILVAVDYANSFRRRYSKQMEYIDETMEEILRDEFGNGFPKFINVKMQEGVWGICIPVESQSADQFSSIYEKINSRFEKELDSTVSMAVSENGYSVNDIPYLYAQTLTILSYRFLLGQNRIITQEDIREQEQNKYEYPKDLEKKFLSSLFTGKSAESLRAYEDFVEKISNFPVGEVRFSFLLLAHEIKNASASSTAEAASVLIEYEQFSKKLQVLETIDEVNQMFINLISEVVEKLQSYAMEKHEGIINQIKTYVEENCGQISLSMNEISEHINMSATYLGRMFKQVTGSTFTEYLTKYRLDTACGLLRETDMTVNDISDRVGFTNSSYFYIVFKKNVGCTPNQYRKQNLGG